MAGFKEGMQIHGHLLKIESGCDFMYSKNFDQFVRGTGYTETARKSVC